MLISNTPLVGEGEINISGFYVSLEDEHHILVNAHLSTFGLFPLNVLSASFRFLISAQNEYTSTMQTGN